jgi:hypothetical protein
MSSGDDLFSVSEEGVDQVRRKAAAQFVPSHIAFVHSTATA